MNYPTSKLEIFLTVNQHYNYALRFMLGEDHIYAKWIRTGVEFATYLYGLFKNRPFGYGQISADDWYKKEQEKYAELRRVRDNLEFPLRDVILMPVEFFQKSRSIYIYFFYAFTFIKENGEEVVAKFDKIETHNFWDDSMMLTLFFAETKFSFEMKFVNGFLELVNEDKFYEDFGVTLTII